MLIIQRNLFTWSESSEKIISKKFGELILMEYLWSFLEREWIDIIDKSILDSQSKFDDVSRGAVQNPDSQNPDTPKSRHSKSRQVRNPDRYKIPTGQNLNVIKFNLNCQ